MSITRRQLIQGLAALPVVSAVGIQEALAAPVGPLTGFRAIDEATGGLKPGELWIHAAKSGEGRRLFALNVASNLATRYHTNVHLLTTESSYKSLICIHSADVKFKGQDQAPLDRNLIRGKASDTSPLYNKVMHEFAYNPSYARLDLCVLHSGTFATELIPEHTQLAIADELKLLHRHFPTEDTDHIYKVNRLIKRYKQFAIDRNIPVLLTLDLGSHEPFVGPYVGFNAYSEIGRSANVVTVSSLDDDLRSRRRIRILNWKNRYNPPFSSFEAEWLPECGKIRDVAANA